MKTKNLLLTAILIILSLIGGSSAEAQIIYTDVIPDTIVSVTDSMYHLDLNNDGITDFDLTYTYDQAGSMDCGSLSQTIISIASIDSNAVLSDSTNLTLALSCPASSIQLRNSSFSQSGSRACKFTYGLPHFFGIRESLRRFTVQNAALWFSLVRHTFSNAITASQHARILFFFRRSTPAPTAFFSDALLMLATHFVRH